MNGWLSKTWPLKTWRAEGSLGDLRAFFYLLLLLPYSLPEGEAQSGQVGVDAPPPPVLESFSRPGTFGGLERRVVGPLPVANGLGVLGRVWRFVPPRPVWPTLKRAALAEFQQWRLEGG